MEFKLWFDDEERQDTTAERAAVDRCSCGLMMKKDKIQRQRFDKR